MTLKLYAAPKTRAIRIAWLLEELGLPYVLELVTFQPTSSAFFIQHTPTGKIPTLEDGEVVLCESGAITEYILERYGEGRLAPEVTSPLRGEYLQWFHFAESSAFAPIGVVVWLTLYRDDAGSHPDLIDDAIGRAVTTLRFLEQRMEGRSFLVGGDLTAADVMMGFTLAAAQALQLLDDLPELQRYFENLSRRPAFQLAVERVGGF